MVDHEPKRSAGSVSINVCKFELSFQLPLMQQKQLVSCDGECTKSDRCRKVCSRMCRRRAKRTCNDHRHFRIEPKTRVEVTC